MHLYLNYSSQISYLLRNNIFDIYIKPNNNNLINKTISDISDQFYQLSTSVTELIE